MTIPYETIQKIAEQFGLSHIIMFAFEPEENKHHIVTWGDTIIGSDQAAEFGNTLKEKLGWPESLYKTSPKLDKLMDLLGEALWYFEMSGDPPRQEFIDKIKRGIRHWEDE